VSEKVKRSRRSGKIDVFLEVDARNIGVIGV
jgi:hypothetical protein